MRKKLLLFIIAAIFTFSSMTVLAAEDTADKDAKDKKSAAATIDTSLYYYNNFDNDAYRDAYNQLKEAADAFHNSNQNAEYENANTENSYYKAFSINVTSKTWEVIGPTGMQAVINAFLADNPTYFWMSPSFNYSTKSLDGGAVCYNVEIVCYNDYANGSSRQVIKNNIDISVSNLAGNLEKDLPDTRRNI